MKVLLVTNDYPPRAGGIQQYLQGWVDAFPGEVRVLGPKAEEGPPGVVRGRRRFMWPTRSVRRWVAAQVDDFEPDVVLFGAPYPLARLGPGLRAATGVPYAVLCHGAEITLPAAFPGSRQLLAGPLRKADALFAVSRFTAGRVERLTGRRVRVVGAGIESRFSPGEPPDGVVVGCVSRFVPRKGQRRVIDAVAALRRDGRDVSLLLAGRGRDERRLRRHAERRQVPTTFEVGMPYDQLPDIYRRMSVFAMPSRSRWLGLEAEGLGLVYLEAAASGLPVITGDSGGSPETIQPGVTGFVTDSDRGLVDALRYLVDDPERAQAMGRAGAEWVANHWTWEAVVERYLEVFEEVASSE